MSERCHQDDVDAVERFHISQYSKDSLGQPMTVSFFPEPNILITSHGRQSFLCKSEAAAFLRAIVIPRYPGYRSLDPVVYSTKGAQFGSLEASEDGQYMCGLVLLTFNDELQIGDRKLNANCILKIYDIEL